MAIVLTWQGSTPGQPQYGLATLTEHYKVQNDDGSQITAADVMIDGGVPQQGNAHPDFSFMFCTDRYCAETGESASALDVTYMGCLTGNGSPDLPPQQTNASTAIQAAASSAARDGRRADPPMSVQFYAPTSTLSYISYAAPGTDTAPDPTGAIISITLTVADQAISIGSGVIQDLIDAFFDVQTLETHQSTEIVAGKYWQNVSQKTKSYAAFILNIAPGPLVGLANPGINYTVGDILRIAGGGGSAVITVAATGIEDSITGFTTSSVTIQFSVNGLGATGGGGTGATFNVLVIT